MTREITIPADFADDADLEHEWAKLWRIPLVDHPHPRWKYEVALVVPRTLQRYGGQPEHLYGAVWPNDDEAEIIASYIDYRRAWYNDPWQAGMLRRPLDVDSGTNTVILCKRADGWRYRRASFDGGLWPYFNNADMIAQLSPDKAGLMKIIEFAEGGPECLSRRFDEWRRDHAELWSA